MEKNLLLFGTIMPFVYFAILFFFGAINPEYNQIQQAPSDLGADGAPYLWMDVFNAGLVLVGMFGILGGIGLVIGLYKIDMGKIFAILAGLTIIMPSINMILSGVNPLPDPNHSLLEMLFPVFFAPLFASLIVKRITNLTIFVVILFIGFVLNIIIFAGIMGVGGFVTENNIGLWIRIWAFIVMPSSGLMCWLVRTKLQAINSI